jgi:hypothetical protein
MTAWAGSLVRCWSSMPPRFRRAYNVVCHKAGSVMEGHLNGRADVALSKSMTALNIRSDEAVVTRFGVLDLWHVADWASWYRYDATALRRDVALVMCRMRDLFH